VLQTSGVEVTERITSSYLHHLQAIYHRIDSRGICVSPSRIEEARAYVKDEIAENLLIASKQWGLFVYAGAGMKPPASMNLDSVNINSTRGESSLLNKLKVMGYKIPKVTKKDKEGEYDSKESTAQLAIRKMLVTNQFNFAGGDPALRAIIRIRELSKLTNSYLNARLYNAQDGNLLFLTNYNVGGTVTGRRSSKQHVFGFGNNAQNFPKHGKDAKTFRRCLVARPGNILLMVDQMQAEDWPVSALANNTQALEELRNGVDRHTKFASSLFNIPVSAKTLKEWKDSQERYLGKKTRHASNYDIKGPTLSEALAKEGYSFPPKQCQLLLDRASQLDPSIKQVFHAYVWECLRKTRILRTPAGRERVFFGLRDNDSNASILKEAYAYIPQSTVGDNTGFAVFQLERDATLPAKAIVQEGHDSLVQDIPDSIDTVWHYLQRTVAAFDRTFKFYNGIEIKIPVEVEIGYDFGTTVTLKELSYDALVAAYAELQAKRGTDGAEG
jgi:DNA polymerase I-like protein with 3'-5' exonuclease and polymerase domains